MNSPVIKLSGEFVFMKIALIFVRLKTELLRKVRKRFTWCELKNKPGKIGVWDHKHNSFDTFNNMHAVISFIYLRMDKWYHCSSLHKLYLDKFNRI